MGGRLKTAPQRRPATKDTRPERIMASILQEAGIRHQTQARLPGTPDFYLVGTRVLVFVDGNFFHGFNFNSWRHRLPAQWRGKIAATMRRDTITNHKLRTAGWKVLRIWEHELMQDPRAVLLRVTAALG